LRDIAFNRDQGVVVILGGAHVEKLARLAHRGVEFLQIQDNVFQRLAFATQFLRAFGIIPDAGIFQRSSNFFQARLLQIEVKDTPEDLGSGGPDRRSWFAAG
jgi:hypothetical protein